MYLVAADTAEAVPPEERAGAAPCHARWQDFPSSLPCHHGGLCCETAREWLVAMDHAQLSGGDLLTGPRWLRKRFEWGPSPWPIHWCEIVERKVIDCGAHSALAHEAFTARGLTAFRAQFIQTYDAHAMAQWRTKWGAEKVSDHWLGDGVIYHEGNALLVGDEEVKLWDASAGWWINPRQAGGYGSLAAVRIFAEGRWGGGDGFRWGDYRIKPNVWREIGVGA